MLEGNCSTISLAQRVHTLGQKPVNHLDLSETTRQVEASVGSLELGRTARRRLIAKELLEARVGIEAGGAIENRQVADFSIGLIAPIVHIPSSLAQNSALTRRRTHGGTGASERGKQ